MLYTLIRIAIFVGIGLAIYLGVRRIWRDWTKQFKAEEKEVHQRDLAERARPDVITLKRDKDGTYRPPDDKLP